MQVRSNDFKIDGGLGVVGGVLRVRLNGVVQSIVTNFRFRENSDGSFELEHRPIGFTKWIKIMSGNSELNGLNGLPLIQNYCADIGAFPTSLAINGGTF